MAIYPSSGGFIGSLLRTIQEERSKAPHVLPPAGEPQAPIRAAVQAPLESPISPESPGSARTVSIRPEGVPPTAASAPAGQVVPARSMIGDMGGPGPSEGNTSAQAELDRSLTESNQRINAINQEHDQAANAINQKYNQAAPAPTGAQPRQISDAMQVSNITDSAKAFQEQQLREGLAASQAQKAELLARQEWSRQLNEQVAQINANRNKPGLFQQLSSSIQGATKGAASKIKGLFQRLR